MILIKKKHAETSPNLFYMNSFRIHRLTRMGVGGEEDDLEILVKEKVVTITF